MCILGIHGIKPTEDDDGDFQPQDYVAVGEKRKGDSEAAGQDAKKAKAA